VPVSGRSDLESAPSLKPPPYRDRLTTGIVHFGPGAFHRAHQADYVDRLLHQDPRWGIAAVSLRSAGTIDALRRQNGLYTLAILDAQTSFRTIGPHSMLLGPTDRERLRTQLRDPRVRIVTSTVTEKGYCLAADGTLDFGHSDIERDLTHPHHPVSLIGWLTLGLADRRAEGLPPFTPICCDNVSSNGKKLRDAIVAFAERVDLELARWIAGEAPFPETMVDSITPATDDRLRSLVREATGVDDAVPVSREAFAQWVIEDALPEGAPDLASAGAILTSDVAAWERAKLRILNGAHSTLAYLGLLLGRETVADAMTDPALSEFVRALVGEDIVPTLEPSPIDLRAYADATFARFRNPAIHHRLSQIAWDGSQKLPYRLLDTIQDSFARGRNADRLAMPVAAWILFVELQARSGNELVDPLAPTLKRAAATTDPVHAILDLPEVFPPSLAQNDRFRTAVRNAADALRTDTQAAISAT
jgi:fructuronate reductase